MADLIPGTTQQEHRRRTDQRMRLGDLVRDPRDGMVSVVKSVAVGSWVILSTAFLIQVWYRELTGFDLVFYAMGSTICSGAPLASHIIALTQPRLAGETGKYGVKQQQNGTTS
jgi:predicted membrane protein